MNETEKLKKEIERFPTQKESLINELEGIKDGVEAGYTEESLDMLDIALANIRSNLDITLKLESNGNGKDTATDQELDKHILEHYHGFTEEQWHELKGQFPYCEIKPIIKRALEKYSKTK